MFTSPLVAWMLQLKLMILAEDRVGEHPRCARRVSAQIMMLQFVKLPSTGKAIPAGQLISKGSPGNSCPNVLLH